MELISNYGRWSENNIAH